MLATGAPEDSFTGPNLNITLTCPECKIYPPDLIERFSEGDIVCGTCGLVLSDRVVDTRSEWRTFSNDDQNGDDPSRVGDAGNPLLDSEDLSTMISYAPENVRVGRDLNRAQSKSLVEKKDNALSAAYAKISQMCDGYQLPKIVQDASKEVYKLVYDEKRLRGKSLESIMAAAIFIGCRNSKVARSFKEIWALTNVPKTEIGRVFKIAILVIKEKNATNPSAYSLMEDSEQTTQTSAEDLIRRFCSRLGIKNDVTNAAEHIARKCKENGTLAGRSPITVAATVIYMASLVFKSEVSPSKIASNTGVSEGTIKTSYRVLFESRDKLLDPSWSKNGKTESLLEGR
ncbi:cyclin-like protein [Metschnikowia bicuspidata var. bicuspidata NRRL YB-4993]|uniref:Transcription initiation factor IIB n=1 Tax=Metschnikowia bicuspidata var. bicuspidata NRRL YB-4993 TaxID=869754 RepID=A0A1A0HBM6_9ASCO|nr:cyclin-like protein [Metschnikowia bicuspidata var. bicuspidata NRRL YB-4993]OBA21539.1 cyclin-like protein [Metschnikowia bicuspidata var. bicuspidata NRRL YB-4993]